jgi:hypothetical protein
MLKYFKRVINIFNVCTVQRTLTGVTILGNLNALTLARLGTEIPICLRMNQTNDRVFSPFEYKKENNK